MSVHEKANDLANALKESSEFNDMKQAVQDIEANPEAKQMMEDFKVKQQELQQKMMSGQQPAEDEMKQMESQFEVINMNEDVKKIFDAERRFGAIMEDVNKIMSEALQGISK